MSLSHAMVTVAATATLVSSKDSREPTLCVSLQNRSASVMYIGSSSVTTSSYGYYLGPNAELYLDLRGSAADVYAIVASGTAVVNVLKISGGSP